MTIGEKWKRDIEERKNAEARRRYNKEDILVNLTEEVYSAIIDSRDYALVGYSTWYSELFEEVLMKFVRDNGLRAERFDTLTWKITPD